MHTIGETRRVIMHALSKGVGNMPGRPRQPHRRYFVIDAMSSKRHIEQYNAAKADALNAREMLIAKYKCTGILLRGPRGVALTYKEDPPSLGIVIPGCKVMRQENIWVVTPLKNTKPGKEVQAELDYCAQMQELWQWSLETSLGVCCSVYGNMPDNGFHQTCGSVLADGRTLLSVPNDIKATRLIPETATEITREQWQELDAPAAQ